MLNITKRDIVNDKGKVTGREYLVGDKVFTNADDAYDYISAQNKAEAEALAAAEAEKNKPLRFKIRENGQLQVNYGDTVRLGHFPAFSAYGEQLACLLTHIDEVKAFVEANKGQIAATWSKAKGKSARA